jgi:glucose-1-phosphate thymidylyltransferase
MSDMDFSQLKGYWSDAGTFESLFRASEMVRNMSSGIK